MYWYALSIKYIGGLKMKLDDVVEINLVDRSPREPYRPVSVKGGFKLSFYGGLKMYYLGGLRTDRC